MNCIASCPGKIAVTSLTCLLSLSLAAGCGRTNTGITGIVAGRVTVAGQPLTQGAVVFQEATSGVAINAALQSDGAYRVKTFQGDGLAPGDYKVTIKPQTSFTGHPPVVVPANQEKKPAHSPIPTKYQSEATSGLRVTVKEGDNPPFDFDLR